MSTATRLLTADDLWKTPDHGGRCELVKGELRPMSPADSGHGAFSMNLAAPLHQFVRAKKLGIVMAAETGFIIERDPDTVRAPDAAFIRHDRVAAAGVSVKFWVGAPDLAVETMSPTDTVYEVDQKVQEWLAAGTRLVWVINPQQQTVTVYGPDHTATILGVADTLDGADVVPGFQISVAEIFSI
ncbi:MAG: Uma2 family endonuclease [Deltaproteobacteria bacterium]